MKAPLSRIAAILLVAGVSAADAAPNVPPSEQAGRERYRFTPSPLDRFMQPTQPTEPLMRWDCHDAGSSRWKQRSRRSKGC
jgi:hypothetical protein